MNVGTKELKNRLSHYLRRARSGEIVRVTDRKVVIAEIRGVAQSKDDDRAFLRQLQADGVVTLGKGKFDDFEPLRIRGGSLAREIVDARR
jgi:antitoxin (DNA-binding transcriptional repressor) of toxin-antitoxin stability system